MPAMTTTTDRLPAGRLTTSPLSSSRSGYRPVKTLEFEAYYCAIKTVTAAVFAAVSTTVPATSMLHMYNKFQFTKRVHVHIRLFLLQIQCHHPHCVYRSAPSVGGRTSLTTIAKGCPSAPRCS